VRRKEKKLAAGSVYKYLAGLSLSEFTKSCDMGSHAVKASAHVLVNVKS
jgi:hypothetical protein